VVVIVDPADYVPILKQIKQYGDVDLDTRHTLARKAFAHVTRYNAAITHYFDGDPLPQNLTITESKTLELRYGENPQQQGALYGSGIEQLWGKGLSYTNVLDLESAWLTVKDQKSPSTSIIKHATPCGVALDKTPILAYKKALKSDPQSAFGGVIGLNRTVGPTLAKQIVSRFFEAIIAPEFSDSAVEIFQTKKNLRLIVAPESDPAIETRATTFGWLAQTRDHNSPLRLNIVAKKQPTEKQKKDLRFAWEVVKHVKSNAIVLVKDQASIGIGAGQMSRVDAVRIALKKAGNRANGAVLASDGFFPFPDSVELAAQAGIKAIIQPGGSIRDEDIIEAANSHKIAMTLTGIRVFKH
jgi:phosphoribosylaminoimidazolecarboxamide formyltransferase/IMP cyclohydrolase